MLHKLECLKMRRCSRPASTLLLRFMARYRWRRAIREVRMMVKVKNSFCGIPEGL
jgi:hypothetical protein